MKTDLEIAQAKLLRKLQGKMNECCKQYSLLEDGDRILVGLSGGKDSLAMVELLGRRAKIYVPRFHVIAVHVRVQDRAYLSDTIYLESFCRKWGVEFMVKDTQISSDPTRDKPKDPCFLCSWYRRKVLFDLAQELQCNKIALGHHKDDAVTTAIMNLTFQGRFDTIYPSLQMEKMPLRLIRPLYTIDEADIRRYAELCGYEKQKALCPYEHESSRSAVKPIIEQMLMLNANAKESMLNAILRMNGSAGGII